LSNGGLITGVFASEGGAVGANVIFGKNNYGVALSTTAVVEAGSYEFIDTQTSTGSDFTEFTFADAVDFADYSEMYCNFQFGTGLSGYYDIKIQVGDTDEGEVLTASTYDFTKTYNNAGTLTQQMVTGIGEWSWGSFPVMDAFEGVSGYVRVYLVRDSSNDTFLSSQTFIQGKDVWFLGGGYNTTTQDDLKYFRLFIGADDLESGSNVTCYKVKRS